MDPIDDAAAVGGLLVSLPAGRAAARQSRRWPPSGVWSSAISSAALGVHRTITSLSAGRTHVVGWVTLDELGRSESREALAELVATHRVEHLVIAPMVVDTAEVLTLLRYLDDIEVRVTLMPRLLELASATLTPDVIGAAAGLDVRRLGLSRGERLLKRGLDVVAATLSSCSRRRCCWASPRRSS